jgi:hypothetical protein
LPKCVEAKRAYNIDPRKSEDKPVQFSSDTASYLGEDITLKDFSTDMCQAITTTGTYTCLRIRFVFEKKSQGQLL